MLNPNKLLTASVCVGHGLHVFGEMEALGRVQHYIMLDSRHPVEAPDNRRYLMRQLEAAELKLSDAQFSFLEICEHLEHLISANIVNQSTVQMAVDKIRAAVGKDPGAPK